MADSMLRPIAPPFVTLRPSGVAVRDRLKGLTAQDEKVLRLVGAHLGALASRDLKLRCADDLEHTTDTWTARKRQLTINNCRLIHQWTATRTPHVISSPSRRPA